VVRQLTDWGAPQLLYSTAAAWQWLWQLQLLWQLSTFFAVEDEY
jgi:hypothetical protein